MLSALPVLAAFDFQFGGFIPIVAIIAPFVMIIAIQISKSVARTQQERMRCEVIRAAIERGQPIPADVFKPLPTEDESEILAATSRTPNPQNDIRSGMILVGVGLGLFLMFGTFQVGDWDGLHGLRWVGAIPAFIGVALIVNGLINRPAATPPSATTTRTAERREEPRS
jgi:hypothetical protein